MLKLTELEQMAKLTSLITEMSLLIFINDWKSFMNFLCFLAYCFAKKKWVVEKGTYDVLQEVWLELYESVERKIRSHLKNIFHAFCSFVSFLLSLFFCLSLFSFLFFFHIYNISVNVLFIYENLLIKAILKREEDGYFSGFNQCY